MMSSFATTTIKGKIGYLCYRQEGKSYYVTINVPLVLGFSLDDITTDVEGHNPTFFFVSSSSPEMETKKTSLFCEGQDVSYLIIEETAYHTEMYLVCKKLGQVYFTDYDLLYDMEFDDYDDLTADAEGLIPFFYFGSPPMPGEYNPNMDVFYHGINIRIKNTNDSSNDDDDDDMGKLVNTLKFIGFDDTVVIGNHLVMFETNTHDTHFADGSDTNDTAVFKLRIVKPDHYRVVREITFPVSVAGHSGGVEDVGQISVCDTCHKIDHSSDIDYNKINYSALRVLSNIAYFYFLECDLNSKYYDILPYIDVDAKQSSRYGFSLPIQTFDMSHLETSAGLRLPQFQPSLGVPILPQPQFQPSLGVPISPPPQFQPSTATTTSTLPQTLCFQHAGDSHTMCPKQNIMTMLASGSYNDEDDSDDDHDEDES